MVRVSRLLASVVLTAASAGFVLAGPPTPDVSFLASRDYQGGGAGIIAGDFNGDGMPDLATFNANLNSVSVILNKGDGTYLNPVTYAAGTGPSAISSGDFNGDGKLDIATVNRTSSDISILLSNGDGTFHTQVVTGITAGNLPSSLVIGDFNGDGFADAAVSVSLPQVGQHAVAIMLGNGDGTFQAALTFSEGTGSNFAVGDFNGDGRLDVVCTGLTSNAISVLLGNGDGTFKPGIDTSAIVSGQTLHLGRLAVGDFNHDGKVDVAVANGANTSLGFYTFIGKGDGSFQAPISTKIVGGAASVSVGDFDSDGLPDVMAVGGGSLALCLGKGDGTFQPLASFTLGQASGQAVIADLNGDGKLDLAVPDVSSNTVSIVLGNGDGTFQVAPTVSTLVGNVLATADINLDGRSDLITGGNVTASSYQLAVSLGNGDGTFQAPLTIGMNDMGPIAAGDFNLDGKPDLAISRQLGGIGIMLGRGDGTFQPLVLYTGSGLPAGDFNGDGKADLIGLSGGIYLTPGHGDGTFGFGAVVAPISFPATSLIAGDFNSDGKLDVLVAGSPTNNAITGQVAILLGNGNGTFQAERDWTVGDLVTAMVLGDFNHDGALDAAITTSKDIGTHGGTLLVLLGDNAGNLQAPVTYSIGLNPRSINTNDFNNDGIADLVTVNQDSSDVSILLGNGDGTFQPATNFQAGRPALSAAVADFNGDGRPDVIAASATGVSLLSSRPLGPAFSNATLTPSSIDFGGLIIGTLSSARVVTLTSVGSATTSISSIVLTGAQASNFSEEDTCGNPLGPGASCAFSVTFHPSASGPRTASIVITDDALNSPQIISLSGSGVPLAPGINLAPTSLDFSSQGVGTSGTPRSVTLTNSGNAALAISGFQMTGSQSTDYKQTNTCGTSLAAGANCTVTVTFTPASTGSRTATLMITDNAVGSPHSLALSGTGMGFGFSAPTQSATVAAGQTTTYSITLNPMAGFNQTVALSCSGAPAMATCSVSPSSVALDGSNPVTATIMVTTTARSVAPFEIQPDWPLTFSPFTLVTLLSLAITLSLFASRQPHRQMRVGAFCSSIALCLCLVACAGGGGSGTGSSPATSNGPSSSSGSSGTPAGSFTLTVTGTSGNLTNAANLTLTVIQPTN